MKIKNVRAPRRDFKNFFGRPEFYRYFLKKYKGAERYSPSEFNKVSTEFYNEIVKLIVEEGFEWNIFSKMGKVAIYKYKPEIKRLDNGRLTLPINPKETAKLWKDKPELKHKKYVYYFNEHSDGYICKIFWTKFKKEKQFINQYFINFTPVKSFRSKVHTAIMTKQSHKNYFTYNNLNKG